MAGYEQGKELVAYLLSGQATAFLVASRHQHRHHIAGVVVLALVPLDDPAEYGVDTRQRPAQSAALADAEKVEGYLCQADMERVGEGRHYRGYRRAKLVRRICQVHIEEGAP